MVHEVKIYDGEGNYVKTIQPQIDYSGKILKSRKFQSHPCRGCKDPTTNLHYCSKCQYDRKMKNNV
mgnify:CR=1 FL=1|jgi:hypothetical protein